MKNKNNNLGLLILRISIGFLMLLHGIDKFKGIAFIEDMLTAKGLPSIMAYGVFLTELVAPLLIIIGFRTRIASIAFAIGTLTAMFLAHSGEIFSLNQYGAWSLELLGLYLLGSVALFFTGGGKLSLSNSNQWD